MRKKIIIAGSIALLILAFVLGRSIANNNSKKQPNVTKVIKTAYVKTVTNTSIPVTISTSGNLRAKNKIDLFAEVQGVLKPVGKDFKPGTKYYKGETILAINSAEFYANLQAQKSAYFNSLTAIMPDIQLDFPEEYQKWQQYLNTFNINKTTPKLPQVNSDKEKFFISGRGIITNYYNVKNLETKLGKFNIRAPFSGILTEAMVTQGTLVRMGQKLGEFINTDEFELEVNVNEAYANLLQKGNKVTVTNLDNSKSWTATVARINAKIDQNTQTVKAFLTVKGDGLRDGMYLNANLQTKEIDNAYKIQRKLLVNNNQVYVVNDSILNLTTINPVYFGNETVIIKGLDNGTAIVSKTLPGAYNGMPVKTINDTE